MTIMVRHIIDDLDPDNYEFSDDRIEEAILVSAQLIYKEMEFATEYTIEVDNRILSPDPTTTAVGEHPKDYDFIAICCLHTGLFFTNSLIKTYSLKSVMLRDQNSVLDMRQIVTGLKMLHDDLLKKYEQTKLDYQTSGGAGKAILGPYSPGSFAWNSSYQNHRAGDFL